MSYPEPAEGSRPTRKPRLGKITPTTEPDKEAAIIATLMKIMRRELDSTPMVIWRLNPVVRLRPGSPRLAR